MKTNYSLIIFFAIVMVVASGCDDYYHDCIRGNGPIVTETRDVDDFNRIFNEIHADLHITQGETFEVSIRGREDVIDEIDFDLNGNELSIDSRYCIKNASVDIFITMPTITSVTNSGSGDILGTNLWVVDDIDLKMSGSGNIRADVEGDDIEVRINGSGDINITGDCDRQEIRISGSGRVRNFGLICNDADITITGSGRTEVNVNDNLDVRISGSGSVFYRGNPDVNSSISGSGRVVDDN